MNSSAPEQLAARLSRALDEAETSAGPAIDLDNRRFGFSRAGINVLLPATATVEYRDALPIFPLPRTRSWFRGLANVRGNLVPVYDLAPLAPAGAQAGPGSGVLIHGEGESAVGMVMDGEMMTISLDEVSPAPAPEALSPLLERRTESACRAREATWFEVDFVALLGDLRDAAPA